MVEPVRGRANTIQLIVCTKTCLFSRATKALGNKAEGGGAREGKPMRGEGEANPAASAEGDGAGMQEPCRHMAGHFKPCLLHYNLEMHQE